MGMAGNLCHQSMEMMQGSSRISSQLYYKLSLEDSSSIVSYLNQSIEDDSIKYKLFQSRTFHLDIHKP